MVYKQAFQVLHRCTCQYMHTVFIIHWSLWGPLVLKSDNLPSQVLGFAAFFALVLKKVDQEEYGEPQIDESLRNTGMFFANLKFLSHCFVWKKNTYRYNIPLTDDPDAVRAARRDSTCSFYQPPPPTDIERMRNNMIKEQKVFALVREILGRRTTLIHNNTGGSVIQFWDADVRYLFVMQPTWDLCGCCSWWRTVRGTPTLTFWPSTFDRASAKGFQTVWVFRMCSTGQTRLCWATCLESTQVLTVAHNRCTLIPFMTKCKTHVNYSDF